MKKYRFIYIGVRRIAKTTESTRIAPQKPPEPPKNVSLEPKSEETLRNENSSQSIASSKPNTVPEMTAPKVSVPTIPKVLPPPVPPEHISFIPAAAAKDASELASSTQKDQIPSPRELIRYPAAADTNKENVPENSPEMIKGSMTMNGPTNLGLSCPLAPRENQPKYGGARPYGVHTGDPNMAEPSKPWQEKYGSKSVEDLTNPKPFTPAGDIPSGLKPWQLSRLRGLEAKGYQFAHEDPKSGADFSDSFYHGHTSIELENVELKSYSPFLVSGRSQSVDREKRIYKAYDPAHSQSHSLEAHKAYGSQGESLPYCDL